MKVTIAFLPLPFSRNTITLRILISCEFISGLFYLISGKEKNWSSKPQFCKLYWIITKIPSFSFHHVKVVSQLHKYWQLIWFSKACRNCLKCMKKKKFCGRHSFSVNLVVSEVCFSFLLLVKQFISSLLTVYVTLWAAVGSSVAVVVYWLPRNFLFLFIISYFSFAIIATNFNLAFKTKEKIVA